MSRKPVLFVLTSHTKLGNTGEETGFHFEEMAAPYYVLKDAGIPVELASIEGGAAKADPSSVDYEQTDDNPESVQRYMDDSEAMESLENTKAVADCDMADYNGIYMPGGHGTMWDFPDNEALQSLILQAFEDGKVIAAVCHGPAALVNIETDGQPIFKGCQINSFTDEEEKAIGKDDVVPFMLESKLREQGAEFHGTGKWEACCIEDGPFITGQNPASAQPLGEKLRDRILKVEMNRAA